MNTPDSFRALPTAVPATRGRTHWLDLLSNVSMGWKMALIILIMSLGAIGMALAGMQGLGVMRYHVSNLYNSKLAPIASINRANLTLADTQLHLAALRQPGLTPSDRVVHVSWIQASETIVNDIMTDYETEWVTIADTEFTAILRDQGQLALQKDEVDTLAAYHTWYGQYAQAQKAYLASIQAGTPDDQLAIQAVQALSQVRALLEHLSIVNNEFARLSNDAAVSAYRQTLRNMGLALSLALLFGLASSFVVARSITLRLGNLTEAASSLRQGQWGQRLTVVGRDEIAWLSKAFNTMSDQLYDLIGSLEQRVAERTAALSKASDSLSRRVNQLQTSAEVARTAATLTEPEQLLTRVVELIQQRFEFYYVALFLVDAEGRYAVLQRGTGEAGRAMRERGHRLEVGGQSMVGWVCANQQARIALDVGDEPVRFVNPLLPETHSEMALPLRVGERMLGVLDVQSTRKSAFDEDDVAVLQSMADQVAVALENARLFQQYQDTLQELQATNRLLVREGWQAYVGQQQMRHRVEFLSGAPTGPESVEEPLTVPLELHGQPLGRLTLRREGDRTWSDEELEMIQAIALQTALSADNARLIEQTRQALGEARALYETSREITSAREIGEVLAAVLDDLAHTGVHAAAIALFDTPTREQAKYIELAGVWDHMGTPRLAQGVRFAIADFTLFGRITDEGALVSADLLVDPGLDDMAKKVLGGLGLRGMAITPLVARDQWIGLLFALTEQPHTFTWAELNFHRALADQAAVAIDNRRLLAETQQRAHREALIRQITTRIRAASDVHGVLQVTAAELARSLGASRAIVRLTVGEDERTQ